MSTQPQFTKLNDEQLAYEIRDVYRSIDSHQASIEQLTKTLAVLKAEHARRRAEG